MRTRNQRQDGADDIMSKVNATDSRHRRQDSNIKDNEQTPIVLPNRSIDGFTDDSFRVTQTRKRILRQGIAPQVAEGSGDCEQKEKSKTRGKISRLGAAGFYLKACHQSGYVLQAITWAKARPFVVGAMLFSIPFILRPSRFGRFLSFIGLMRWYPAYFGNHPIAGGPLGRKIDYNYLTKVYERTKRENQEKLGKLGITELPYIETLNAKEQINVLNLNTRAAIRELLVRRERRAVMWNELELQSQGLKLATDCKQCDGVAGCLNPCGIPRILLLPQLHNWEPPRPGLISGANLIPFTFDETEMRDFLSVAHPQLRNHTKQETNVSTTVWALAALTSYGGVFLGDQRRSKIDTANKVLFGGSNRGILDIALRDTPVAIVSLERTGTDFRLKMLMTTPNHPFLECALGELQAMSLLNVPQLWRMLMVSKEPSFYVDEGWKRALINCPAKKETGCCHSNSLVSVTDVAADYESQLLKVGKIVVYVQIVKEEILEVRSAKTAQVEIQHTSRASTEPSTKVRLETLLRLHKADPGWLCTRCIKTPWYGSMEKCSFFCPTRYEELVCRSPDKPPRREVPVDVNVLVPSQPSAQRIPRIIHQTWFEDLTIDRYPQLVRLQNSWKQSGWEYRFYDDAAAKEYVIENFPYHFAEAFDSLIPGAYKADFFRYLVLMKTGGVYADVDVMLDTNLDSFITPSMSFFAPRDIVGEYAGQPFCLWNGLIGAAPGHPFLIRAVERLVNLILDRSDLYDMERDICRRSEKPIELWKVRAEPLLLFSGPCALGVAANEALNRSSLEPFDIGWISMENLGFGGKDDHGDALILVGDKFDMGAFRISDPERNFVVASTDLDGVEKKARIMANPTIVERNLNDTRQKQLPHYSKTAKGVYVWGSARVYKDNEVANEKIKFFPQYHDE